MDLTTRSLGARTEELVWKREWHPYMVDGLPESIRAMIVEERGQFTVRLLDVATSPAAPVRTHESMESALEELRELASVRD